MISYKKKIVSFAIVKKTHQLNIFTRTDPLNEHYPTISNLILFFFSRFNDVKGSNFSQRAGKIGLFYQFNNIKESFH